MDMLALCGSILSLAPSERTPRGGLTSEEESLSAFLQDLFESENVAKVSFVR